MIMMMMMIIIIIIAIIILYRLFSISCIVFLVSVGS